MQQSSERRRNTLIEPVKWTTLGYETSHPALILESGIRQSIYSGGKELWAFSCFCGLGRMAESKKGGYLGCCWHQTTTALSPCKFKRLCCFLCRWPHENKVRLMSCIGAHTELCSSTDGCASAQKAACFAAWGRREWRQRSRPVGGPSTYGHLQQLPSSHGPSIWWRLQDHGPAETALPHGQLWLRLYIQLK